MSIYIHGIGNISPQKTWDDSALPLQEPLTYSGNRLSCHEPDYSRYIDPKHIRRMSRVLKMGVTAASMALKNASVQQPDGIITGTGYGCLDDTGIFLTKMVENKEVALNPTPFIQSTHNTIGSQIALLLQCQAYNQTYTQRALSFESALLDAVLQLAEGKEKKLLVGGVDEITNISHDILLRFGLFKSNVTDTLDLFRDSSAGTLNGEGACFFLVSGSAENAITSIEGVTTFYNPDLTALRKGVIDFMSHMKIDNVDMILSGKSGDIRSDSIIDNVISEVFTSSSVGFFKHLCGEFPVASSFACWLAAMMLRHQHVPTIVHSEVNSRPLRNILIFNQYFGKHYSLILLKHA